MPTFTAVTLDRLLEPGASKSVDNSASRSSNIVPKPKAISKPKPVLKSSLERRNSASTIERKALRPPISPALYATPESTPLPDSPSSSFPPSPYIVNHKRRGPRLLKSFSEDDVSTRKNALDKPESNGNAESKAVDSPKRGPVTFTIPDPVEDERVDGVCDSAVKECRNGVHGTPAEGEDVTGFDDDEGSSNREVRSSYKSNGKALANDMSKFVSMNSERDVESEDFFDPQDSMSYASNTDVEDNAGAESSVKFSPVATAGEFFDAWEEFSSDSGRQHRHREVEAELREMRLSLLMEIEKRKQAEEALSNMQAEWQRIGQQLSQAGLTPPPCPIASTEGDQAANSDPIDLCQQLYLARFVSESMGRGIAKAEMEKEMEAQLEVKNFEIARLLDRLHYYEAMNQEMSQRNQEAVEMARRSRQIRKRRQRWVWGSIAAAVSVGTAALAWSYLQGGKGSSTTGDSVASEHDEVSK